MATRRLHVLILGRDQRQRALVREALSASPACEASAERDLRVCEAGHARELVPSRGTAFDIVLLALTAGENLVQMSRETAALLPHVPIVSIGDKPCCDAPALVECGVEDHVPLRCARCTGVPRFAAAMRWALERRELLDRVESVLRDCEDRSLHDPLTGLANRALLEDRLEHLLARHRRRRGIFALLFIDLDGFKAVNDNLGHAAGDLLLVEVSRRLSERIRGGDTCARWGGDEFLVLLDDVRGERMAQRVAKELLEVLRAPKIVTGRAVRMNASVGLALFPHDGGDAQTLIRHADAAMYAAKASGGGTIRVAARLGETRA